MKRSAILNFPRSLVDRPVISLAIRNYDIEVNIIQAQIRPEEDGYMFAIFSGKSVAIDQALGFLEEKNIRVVLPKRNLVWDESRCVHCTACVGQCSAGAFSVNGHTLQVEHEVSRCIACKLCIPACSYGALESVGDQLVSKGEF